MAKCDEGYLCDVCGEDVAQVTDSQLYLQYVIGELDPELLHTTAERHIRCNPVLAQFIVDPEFTPVQVDGDFDKRKLDADFVKERELFLEYRCDIGHDVLYRGKVSSCERDYHVALVVGDEPVGAALSVIEYLDVATVL